MEFDNIFAYALILTRSGLGLLFVDLRNFLYVNALDSCQNLVSAQYALIYVISIVIFMHKLAQIFNRVMALDEVNCQLSV